MQTSRWIHTSTMTFASTVVMSERFYAARHATLSTIWSALAQCCLRCQRVIGAVPFVLRMELALITRRHP